MTFIPKLNELLRIALNAAVPGLFNGKRFAQIFEELTRAVAGAPTFTVGAESSNSIAVTVQVNDEQGNAVKEARVVTYWISDTAAGIPSATPPDGTTGPAAENLLKVDTTKVLGRAITDSNGQFVMTLGESTAKTFYLNVSDGGKVASVAVAFA